MCGICGTASSGSAGAIDPRLIEAMTAQLVHRGPDSDGYFADDAVGLGMRRLAIIDLAGGDQPIANEDGTIQVVQNGEIYNHRELRADLEARGHRFSTSSDTEALVHLYEEKGPAFAEALRGMFAVAIWDSREQRLVLARDRFGIKPLYYREKAGTLSFASELKSLLQDPRVSREVDLYALESYLAFNWIPAPLSIFSEVRKLPAGHTLVWERGRATIERYARPGPPPADEMRHESERELEGELRERLRDSVRAHLVSDVPVGVLLSGGVDSCTLAALAAQETDEPLNTFSIGFEEKEYNELDLARLVATRYGTNHHELIVNPDAVDLLPRIAESFDEPFADSSALPTYLVCGLAAEHVKVAFSGEGGDELFGGYRTYVANRLAGRIGGVAALAEPIVNRLPAATAAGRLPDRAKRFTRVAALPAVDRHAGWTEVLSADARAALLTPGARGGGDPVDAYRRRYAETAAADDLARFQDVDLGLYLVDDLLVKTDRMSMAHSLEVRVPFLDSTIADFALALPPRMKVRGFQKKRILRRAAAPLLPDQILKARKRGFSIPAARWFRGELEPYAREVLSDASVRAQGYFEPEAVTSLLDQHVSGQHDLSRQIWGLLSFALWHERYASRESVADTLSAPR